MKVNLPLLKFISQILVLLIMFVVLFILSTIFYSARYWPDVYNYINANITITRIPKISELNVSYEVFTTEFYDVTTEMYEYTDTTDEDLNIDEFTRIDRKKRETVIEETNKDYSVLKVKGVLVDYFFDYGNEVPMKDDVDARKLTTRGVDEVEIVPGYSLHNIETSSDRDDSEKQRTVDIENSNLNCHGNTTNDVYDMTFPWVAAIFLKNESSNQFDYYCDGALLSSSVIVTAAQCVNRKSLTPNQVIVILGKRSLQSLDLNERIHKVKQISFHPDFRSGGDVDNDLAVLIMEEAVRFSENIRPACVGDGDLDSVVKSATTGWQISGDLSPIYFDKQKSKECVKTSTSVNTFCATYGYDVTVCPSYGGIYVSKLPDNLWYLQGIHSGDPDVRGLCVSRDITFTALARYKPWLDQFLSTNKQ